MRAFSRSLIAGALLAIAASAAHAADKQPQLRPEVAKPLQQAQAALQGKSYSDALAKIGEAEKVGELTPYETYVVSRMRAAAALGAGDNATAATAYAAALDSGFMPDAEKVSALETLSKLNYQVKDYAKAADYIQKYRAAGGNNEQTLALLPNAFYLSNNFAAAQKESKVLVTRLQQAGQTPTEIQLSLMGSSAIKQNDSAGYVEALKLLVTYYPQPKYWQDLIARTVSKPGFSDRLTLDIYRLKLATVGIDKPNEYLDAADLSLVAGLPSEADQFLQKGYANKVLGQGGDAAAQKATKDRVAKKLADDKTSLAEGEKAAAAQAGGDALVATGLNYVGYGQYDKGIALIQKGIAKGGLKKPEDAKLHLGYAQMIAGKTADARKTFESVTGADGTADIAQLWLLAKKG